MQENAGQAPQDCFAVISLQVEACSKLVQGLALAAEEEFYTHHAKTFQAESVKPAMSRLSSMMRKQWSITGEEEASSCQLRL